MTLRRRNRDIKDRASFGTLFSWEHLEGKTLEHIVEQFISSGQALAWLAMAFLFGFFVYKEWPEFKRRVSGSAVKEVSDKSVSERLTVIEKDISEIKAKLDIDYTRLNDMDRWKKGMEQIVTESLEEREILMQAMLGVLGGLQELGANGPTKAAKETIQDYINKQAHKREMES